MELAGVHRTITGEQGPHDGWFSSLFHNTRLFSVLSGPPGTVRLILTISLLLSLTLACLSDCVVVLSFSLNRSYIAQNLCEKKDVPGNTCQGCCLLRKELQNEDRKASDGHSHTPDRECVFHLIQAHHPRPPGE